MNLLLTSLSLRSLTLVASLINDLAQSCCLPFSLDIFCNCLNEIPIVLSLTSFSLPSILLVPLYLSKKACFSANSFISSYAGRSSFVFSDITSDLFLNFNVAVSRKNT